MDARTLNCPGCGAPTASDAPSCRYCSARLACVACPRCFGLVFVGSRNCSHCGAEVERRAPEAKPLPCPGCRGEMEPVEVGSTRLHECGSCLGVWLDSATFERLCADAETQAAVLPRLCRTDARGDAAPPPVRYLPCPLCATVMNRVNFARISGVVVDVCRKDGVWLDRGELQRVVEFVRAGGMDRSRHRERLWLEEERRRLEAAQRAQPGSSLGRAADPFGSSRGRDVEDALLAGIARWLGLR